MVEKSSNNAVLPPNRKMPSIGDVQYQCHVIGWLVGLTA